MGHARRKPNMTISEEILYIVREEPGITGKRIREFFEGNGASSVITRLYASGHLRREPVPKPKGQIGGRQTFRYWVCDDPKPVSKPTKLKQPTAAGWEARCHELEAKVAELQLWKNEAINRFPELTVPDIVLRARRIAAKANPDFADALLAGKKDSSPIMLAVVAALEEGE